MNQKNLRLVALGFIAGAIVVTALGLLVQRPARALEPAPLEDTRKRVRVAAVESASATKSVRFAGIVQAEERAALAFTVGGRLVARPAKVGDRVSAGQVLARIDSRPFRNSLAATEASLAEVRTVIAQGERDVSRAEKLAGSKAIGAEELEKVRSALDAARASEASLKARADENRRLVGEATLTAPFAGTITDVFFERGEFAQPGVPAVSISGAGAREIEIEAPESYSAALTVGQTVEVILPLSVKGRVPGTVARIGNAARGAGQLFPITVKIDEPVPAGASAEVMIQLELAESRLVPVEAVANPGGERPFVFRVRDKRVERVFVDVSELIGDSVTVKGKLESGDTVVRAGHANLLDGDAVEVLK